MSGLSACGSTGLGWQLSHFAHGTVARHNTLQSGQPPTSTRGDFFMA